MASWVYWSTNPTPFPHFRLVAKPFWVPSPKTSGATEVRNYRYQSYQTFFCATDPHECPIMGDSAGGSYFALDWGPAYSVFLSEEAAAGAKDLVALHRYRTLPYPPSNPNCLHNWSIVPNYGSGDVVTWVMDALVGYVFDKAGPDRLQVHVFGYRKGAAGEQLDD
jgi:hypothetical protein